MSQITPGDKRDQRVLSVLVLRNVNQVNDSEPYHHKSLRQQGQQTMVRGACMFLPGCLWERRGERASIFNGFLLCHTFFSWHFLSDRNCLGRGRPLMSLTNSGIILKCRLKGGNLVLMQPMWCWATSFDSITFFSAKEELIFCCMKLKWNFTAQNVNFQWNWLR